MTAQQVFVAGTPDRVGAQTGLEDHRIGGDADLVAIGLDDLDVGKHPPQARTRRLGVALACMELLDTQRNPRAVVIDDRHLGFRIDVVAIGRHPVDAIGSPERFPLIELVGVLQPGFAGEELANLQEQGDFRRSSAGHAHTSSISLR
ncbi:hypothetical protein D9M68_890390 [compost metagenome]